MPPGARLALTTPTRIGLGLLVASGALLAASSRADIAAVDTALGSVRVTGSGELAFVGIVVLGVAVVALVRRETSVVLLSCAVGALGAGFAALLVVAAPTDKIFDGLPAPGYRLGGWMSIAAFAAGLAGALLVAATYPTRPAVRGGRHPAGTGSAATGAVSIVVPFLGVLAIGLARLGRQAAALAGRSDRNTALGLVLGILTTALWGIGAVAGILLGVTGNL